MLEVWLFRHGQSRENAGFHTKEHSGVLLTDLGKEQGKLIAEYIGGQGFFPLRIIASPYTRAKETAVCTADRFDMPVEIRRIHEFSFIGNEVWGNIPPEERETKVREYWKRGDPEETMGEGAESFIQFWDRVFDIKQWLCACAKSESGLYSMFSHGYFIRGLVLSVFDPLTARGRDPKEQMRRYDLFFHSVRVHNASLIKFFITEDGKITLSPFMLDHLPAHMLTH